MSELPPGYFYQDPRMSESSNITESQVPALQAEMLSELAMEAAHGPFAGVVTLAIAHRGDINIRTLGVRLTEVVGMLEIALEMMKRQAMSAPNDTKG